jgi:hypothetical protein
MPPSRPSPDRPPSDPSRARFLRPSLGRPAFLSPDDREFGALIISSGRAPDGDGFGRGFSLVSVQDRGLVIPLETRDVREVEGPPLSTAAGQALKKGAFSRFEVRLALGAPPPRPPDPGPRFLLFDLSHPLLDGGRHALACVFHPWESFRFWFAADCHVSARWDRIERDLGRLTEDGGPADPENGPSLGRAFGRKSFQENFINPNRNLARLVRMANERASRGDLDLLILGGDLVDYQIPSAEGSRKREPAATNFDLFEGLICGRTGHGDELRVPLLTVPGNHDYRLFPYEIHHYGLDRCGWHDIQTGYFLRRTDPQSLRAYSLRDLKAVFGRGGRTHPLESYLTRINPDTDHAWTAGRTKFVFLDSGRDAFRNFLHIRPRRWPRFIRAALASWHFPNSAGLSDAQTRFLARESGSEGADNLILVFHAGLVNSHFTAGLGGEGRGPGDDGAAGSGDPGESRLPVGVDDDLRGPDRMRRRLRWERMLVKAGLNYGGLFQNQLPLLRAALSSGRRVLGLSGHFHRNLELRLDKKTGGLYSRDYSRDGLAGSRIRDSSFFLATSALAHVQARYPVAAWPEFFEVRVDEEGIASVRKERLAAFPFDGLTFEARKSRETRTSATIALLSDLCAGGAAERASNLKLWVSFIVFASPARGGDPEPPFDIRPRGTAAPRSVREEWLSENDRREFLGTGEPAFLYSALCDYAPGIEFDFLARTRRRRPARVVALAEYLRDSGPGLEHLRLAWHPRSIRLGRD